MSGKIAQIRRILKTALKEVCSASWMFVRNPEKDFTRNRKISFQDILLFFLCKEGGNLTTELFRYFGLAPDSASVSAFIQQRDKILPEAFITLFQLFTQKACPQKLYKGLRLLAADGSDIQIPTDPNDTDSYFPGPAGQQPYNLLHLNALYDLNADTYIDADIGGKRSCTEVRSLCRMIDRSSVERALVIADRGYESYNLMAHIQEKHWFFLIRVKEAHSIASGLDLPDMSEFDFPVHLSLCRRQTKRILSLFQNRNLFRFIPKNSQFDYLPTENRKHDPVLFYELSFRLVRIRLSDDSFEFLLTNLPKDDFPIDELKSLYHLRWGIETSFRSLKYTVGLLHFHAKKAENILMEVFARLTLYNFSSLVALHSTIPDSKRNHPCKVKFSAAVHLCRQFILGNVSPPVLEALLLRQTSPIRTGRYFPRGSSLRKPVSFSYRIA